MIGQVGDVVLDRPLFLTAPPHRRWHLRWGATDDEVAAAMPGDSILPDAQCVSTRAITGQPIKRHTACGGLINEYRPAA